LDGLQHRRLLHWCLLERRLFHAAFLARQQLLSNRRLPWLTGRITDSAAAALAAVEWLGARHASAAV
jgi:hypothetical protein